ncbi:hypothetical protein ACWDTR_06850 [Streptomyces sp. NPDC003470]
MVLELPSLTRYDVDLVAPATLQGNQAEERVRRRLTVTEPYVTRRTLGQLHELGVDPALLSASSPDDDYFLLAFGCAFRPGPVGDPASFKEASIGIRLGSPEGARPPAALALSPGTGSVPGGSGFRIALSVPLGVAEPAVEYAADGTKEKRYVTAYGAGSSNPEWRLCDRRGHPLDGDVLLAVVVCGAAGTPVLAEVAVAASLRRRMLTWVRAELPPRLHTIDLAARAPRDLPGGAPGVLPPGPDGR